MRVRVCLCVSVSVYVRVRVRVRVHIACCTDLQKNQYQKATVRNTYGCNALVAQPTITSRLASPHYGWLNWRVRFTAGGCFYKLGGCDVPAAWPIKSGKYLVNVHTRSIVLGAR